MSQATPRPKNDPKVKKAQVAPEQSEEEEEEGGAIGQRFLFFNVMPSWMVSFLTHIAVIILLAIIIMPERKEKKVTLETSEAAASLDEDSISIDLETMDFEESDPLETEMTEEVQTEVVEEVEVVLPEAVVDIGNVMASETEMEFEEAFEDMPSASSANETSARSGSGKSEALRKGGGTPGSEKAVELALKWIIAHQLPDGGWNFNHQMGPGNHRTSPNPGEKEEARAGATAMAILPLLGNGQTHKVGTYQKEIEAGLAFLMKRAKRSGRGLSYLEPGGTMYSHGLVSIVFCEAYAMTKDPALAPFAQGTVWFIEDAQDPVGGGWRYRPRERGDTSAVGWQLMALKSGKITGLNISKETYKGAEKFLDSVSTDYGAFYGYTDPPKGEPADARTAVGLLCRMYMGWPKDAPGLVKGMNAITSKGPSTSGSSGNMYYNYYATQAVKQFGGKSWKEWNSKMRDFLVKGQETEGDAAGSWTPDGSHGGRSGGRLYQTSMAAMTLEVYYRYLPLYDDKATSDEFMLD